ncbi:peptide chain release factor N(5)-glutamine methyltransferase [Bdellovibrio sp. qaytius]|nr:peptide chain release factor N(5)-glutamine methyltransferase [Bdellovibrio sp. qaytius]
MKLNDVLQKTIQFFKDKNFDTPRLDAELLIAHALKLPRIQLYAKFDSPLSEAEVNLCRDYVKRRTAGEPVAYIIEEKGFYGHIFKVKSGVLIPRPETEMIIDEVLKDFKKHPKDHVRILDLGAGTGCIGLSILKHIPLAELVTVEKSAEAFALVQENIASLDLSERTKAIHADVASLNAAELGEFDYIVSNPPYIDVNDTQVEVNVRKFEPSMALFSEENGLYALKSWSAKFAPSLKAEGLMLFEMGHTQGDAMKKHFSDLAKLKEVTVLKDLSGLDRIIKGRA